MLRASLHRYLISFTCIASSLSAFNVNELSLEEKVGQLFVVCFKGETVNETAKELVQKLHVGGIIYYDWANGLGSPLQVFTLSSKLQELTLANKNPIPLLIAIDQEGGVVARLKNGFTSFPGNKALAMTKNAGLAKESAYVIGKELLAVGVNFNLAPIVDINCNPKNPVIGIRSFGETAETVVSFADKAIEGYKKAGILTCIKHFPGHGDVEIDSHKDLPVLTQSKQELEQKEFIPFKKLSSQTDTAMTAHISVPSIDPLHCATLSKPILSILREEIGFEGVIIADSLTMEGVLKNSSCIEEAAISALNAGCDLLLFGGKKLVGTTVNKEISPEELTKIHKAVIQAVLEGRISEERLNEAVQRILRLKKTIKPLKPKTELELNEILSKSEDLLLSEKISKLAIQLVKNQEIPSIKNKKMALFSSALLKKGIQESSFFNLGRETSSFFFTGLAPSEEEIQKALTVSQSSDVIIFFSYNAWKNPKQAELISLLAEQKKPFIFIITRDPLDESLNPHADLILTTFSPSTSSLQAASEELLFRFQNE